MIDSIIAKGVVKEVAINIINSKEDPDEIKKAIITARRCSELDYSPAMAIYCIKNNFDPNTELAVAVNMILNLSDSEDMVTALINGEINAEDLNKMFGHANLLYIEDGDMDVSNWKKCLDRQFKKHMTAKVIN